MRLSGIFNISYWALAFAVAMAAGSSRAAEDRDSKTRLILYQRALQSQLDALDVCSTRMAEKCEEMEGLSGSKLTKAITAFQDIVDTRHFYISRACRTLSAIAGEYSRIGDVSLRQKSWTQFFAERATVADTWRDLAELYKREAVVAKQYSKYSTAANFYEKAYKYYKKGFDSLKKAIAKVKGVDADYGQTDAKERMARLCLEGLETLELCGKAYTDSFNQAKRAASKNTEVVLDENAGEAWLRAATAHKSYERINEKLQSILNCNELK